MLLRILELHVPNAPEQRQHVIHFHVEPLAFQPLVLENLVEGTFYSVHVADKHRLDDPDLRPKHAAFERPLSFSHVNGLSNLARARTDFLYCDIDV